jgi:deoxyribodipyrimidine photo-lyase
MSDTALVHSYEEILAMIDAVDVLAYARSRNYTDGAVSRLSPYISRGVVSLPFVKERILSRYTREQAYAFIFELAWREFFQRQWLQMGEQIWTDIRQPQGSVAHKAIPCALVDAATGIKAIDEGMQTLYHSGYMHNHLRMYVASIACNIAQAHWQAPSRWLYYHLADHDIASNTLSWQWVAGTFSTKKYFCNQENINKFCHTSQSGTFLDHDYGSLPQIDMPEVLRDTTMPDLSTVLPSYPLPEFDQSKPLLIYNAYNLDPLWRRDIDANRLLILEPSHYDRYPVSERVLSFICSLASNIKGIQIYAGELDDVFAKGTFPAIYSRSHPAFAHYPGHKDEREWIFPQVSFVKGSFMSFWKECEKYF